MLVGLTQFSITAPNVYSLPGIDKALHENSPKFSFGSRPDTQKPCDTPG